MYDNFNCNVKYNKVIYKVIDNNGINCEIKDIKNFSKHIFKLYGNGISLHQELGHNFTVNDVFR